MRRTKRITILMMVSILALGVVSAVIARDVSRRHNVSEYINPGAPLLPENFLDKNWFDRGEEAAVKDINPVSVSNSVLPSELKADKSDAGYPFKIRQDSKKSITLLDTIIQEDQLLEDNHSFAGYTFRYSDKVIIGIDPSDQPVDTTEEANSDITPTTDGETRICKMVNLAGSDNVKNRYPAVYRKMAVQKWESGDVNKIPGFLLWSEPTGLVSPKYVHYLIMGDLSLGQLKAIADTLK